LRHDSRVTIVLCLKYSNGYQRLRKDDCVTAIELLGRNDRVASSHYFSISDIRIIDIDSRSLNTLHQFDRSTVRHISDHPTSPSSENDCSRETIRSCRMSFRDILASIPIFYGHNIAQSISIYHHIKISPGRSRSRETDKQTICGYMTYAGAYTMLDD